jgi:hypothetical protein
MLQAIGVALAIIFWFAALSGRSKAHKELLEWGVPLAFQIAIARQWVSPHRLTNQLNLTKSDAQAILFEACRLGLLYQALNGRYYPNPDAVLYPNQVEATVAEERPESSPYSRLELFLVFLIGITLLTGLFIVTDRWPKVATTSKTPPTQQAIEKPSPQTVVVSAIKEAAEVSTKGDGSYEIVYTLDPVLSLGVKHAREQSLQNAAMASDAIFHTFDDAERVIVKTTATYSDKKRAGQTYAFNTVTFSRKTATNRRLKDVVPVDVPKVADSYWESPTINRGKK